MGIGTLRRYHEEERTGEVPEVPPASPLQAAVDAALKDLDAKRELSDKAAEHAAQVPDSLQLAADAADAAEAAQEAQTALEVAQAALDAAEVNGASPAQSEPTAVSAEAKLALATEAGLNRSSSKDDWRKFGKANGIEGAEGMGRDAIADLFIPAPVKA